MKWVPLFPWREVLQGTGTCHGSEHEKTKYLCKFSKLFNFSEPQFLICTMGIIMLNSEAISRMK